MNMARTLLRFSNLSRFTLAAIVMLAVSVPLYGADWQTVGDVVSFAPVSHGIELRTQRATVRITALSPSVVRLQYARGNTVPTHYSFAVVKDTGFTAPRIAAKDLGRAVEFSTGKFKVRVEKAGTRVLFIGPDGSIILQDEPHYPVTWNGTAFRVTKDMPTDEHYFGLGARSTAMNRRNVAFTMWNTDAYNWQGGTDPLYKSIPFFTGMREGKAYGVFLDNTWRSWFDFGKESRDYYAFGSDGGELDYYFLYGPGPKDVVSEYTALTGRTPLPPLFSLGYQQSRYSYYPEARVREIAAKLRQDKIPCDVIYLDIDYEQGHKSFTINREYFPTFEEMVHDLGEEGFKLVTIVDLHLAAEKGYKPYDEGMAQDLFLKNPDGTVYVGNVWPGPSVFPDFTMARTRKWFGGLYAGLVNMGVRGFWNDMNEPSVFNTEKTIPLDVVSRVDIPGDGERKATQREIHNVVGMENVRATYDGLLRLRPDERPFVLTRAAYAGTQRYAATWTGDNQSTWEQYGLTLPTLLSLGVSGYAFVGNDVGGFTGSPTADLLTRWFEVGAFIPMFRDHTSTGTRNQEPWVNGPEQEDIRRKYIDTRYRLLPYIYTQMEYTSRTGVPLMRPMFMEFPQAKELTDNQAEYMFGDSLLVAPKMTEMLDPYEVILPKGQWYDYWTGKLIAGGKKLTVDPPLDSMPVYARGGSIIPHEPLVQTTQEVPQGPLELRVYPGPNCHGSVYADDGNTFAYKQGEFMRQSFTCEASKDAVRVDIGTPQGPYKPWWTNIEVTAFGATNGPTEVSVDGKMTSEFKYDPTFGTVAVEVPGGRATQIVITY